MQKRIWAPMSLQWRENPQNLCDFVCSWLELKRVPHKNTNDADFVIMMFIYVYLFLPIQKKTVSKNKDQPNQKTSEKCEHLSPRILVLFWFSVPCHMPGMDFLPPRNLAASSCALHKTWVRSRTNETLMHKAVWVGLIFPTKYMYSNPNKFKL